MGRGKSISKTEVKFKRSFPRLLNSYSQCCVNFYLRRNIARRGDEFYHLSKIIDLETRMFLAGVLKRQLFYLFHTIRGGFVHRLSRAANFQGRQFWGATILRDGKFGERQTLKSGNLGSDKF